jgi:hypothetical protein
MIFCLYTNYGALNSKPIFEAFAKSLKDAGHSVIYNEPYKVMEHYDNYDVAVIWSVLWHGRMTNNKQIWQINRDLGKPVIVLEVGGIKRGTTWKVGLNGINRDAFFGDGGNNSDRARRFGLEAKPWRTNGEYVLVCGQHEKSEQWRDQPRMSRWVIETIENVQAHTDRPIIFRPHPRCPLPNIEQEFKNVKRQDPRQVPGSYDDYDIDYSNIYTTVSWTSNPGIHSVLNGVPAYTSTSSLAWPVSIKSLTNLDNPPLNDRQQWLNDYAWTEYTVEEISQGLPLKRLTSKLF